MHRGSKDRNHGEVKAAFAAMGCSTADTALAGIPGFPDLVVGCVGVNHLVEIKNAETGYGRRGFSAEQSAFNDEWRGETMVCAYSTDDAIKLVTLWRAQSKPKWA